MFKSHWTSEQKNNNAVIAFLMLFVYFYRKENSLDGLRYATLVSKGTENDYEIS